MKVDIGNDSLNSVHRIILVISLVNWIKTKWSCLLSRGRYEISNKSFRIWRLGIVYPFLRRRTLCSLLRRLGSLRKRRFNFLRSWAKGRLVCNNSPLLWNNVTSFIWRDLVNFLTWILLRNINLIWKNDSLRGCSLRRFCIKAILDLTLFLFMSFVGTLKLDWGQFKSSHWSRAVEITKLT